MADKDDQMNDFMESALSGLRTYFEPGEKVRGKVVAIGSSAVFVDIGSTSEGIIERSELTDKDGNLAVQEGDEIDAYFLGTRGGEMHLAVKMQGGDADDERLFQAYQSGIPVEGQVVEERKGGFEVRLGNKRAFCPFSQIGRGGVEAGDVVGRTLSFLITEFDDGNVVVSRRQLLDRQAAEAREELKETLNEGDVVEGVVARIMDFGVFVDIGGVDGLIPMSQLAWGHVDDAHEIVSEGDPVRVRIERIDWDRDRIALSRKAVEDSPWTKVEENYTPGKVYAGKVARLMDFGAFVELEPGIDGLLHISKIGRGRRIGHPREELEEGQQLDVRIDAIDTERQRISLDLPGEGKTESPETEAVFAETIDIHEGDQLTGIVEDIRQFGIFVKLDPEKTGLLHVSELGIGRGGNAGREMYKLHPPGSEIQVIIQEIKGDRISLTVPQRQTDDDYRDMLADEEAQGDFGSLGDVFGGLDLE